MCPNDDVNNQYVYTEVLSGDDEVVSSDDDGRSVGLRNEIGSIRNRGSRINVRDSKSKDKNCVCIERTLFRILTMRMRMMRMSICFWLTVRVSIWIMRGFERVKNCKSECNERICA